MVNLETILVSQNVPNIKTRLTELGKSLEDVSVEL